MRREGAQRLAFGLAAQIAGQRRALPDRENSRFRARMIDRRGDIAGGEDAGMRRRLQRVVNRNETLIIDIEPGFGKPWHRPGRGYPEDFIERDRRLVFANQQSRFDPHDLVSGMDLHPAFAQHAAEYRADPPVVGVQDLIHVGDQMEAQTFHVPAARRQQAGKPVLHREQQLNAARTTADNADPHGFAAFHDTVAQAFPMGEEFSDRLDRHDVAWRAGNGLRHRSRADIDRQQIIGHRRAVGA